MSELIKSIKAEIVRLSRKEIKTAVAPLRSANATLKKQIAELKASIAQLESNNKQFLKSIKPEEPQILQPEEVEKLRITSRVIRNLRSKLGLSQDSFAKLMGVSSQNVHLMEHKEGKLNLRQSTMSKFLSIRGIGKREAQKRLAELETIDQKAKE